MKVTATQATKDRVRSHLRAWIELASVENVHEGKTWYRDARDFIQALSEEYKVHCIQVCGVVAALSPSTYWALNKRQAENLIRAHTEGTDLDTVAISTYGNQAQKARDILRFGHLGVDEIRTLLGRRAFKTWAFFDNLRYPQSNQVTIDQHMVAAVRFEDQWVTSAQWCYTLIADEIRILADELGWHPYQVQAVIWVAYKALADARSPEEKLPF